MTHRGVPILIASEAEDGPQHASSVMLLEYLLLPRSSQHRCSKHVSHRDVRVTTDLGSAGMSRDLGLTTAEYQWLLTVFYIVYSVSQWEFILLKFAIPR